LKPSKKHVRSTLDCGSLLPLWAMQPCCESGGIGTGSPMKPRLDPLAAGYIAESGSRLPQSKDFVGNPAQMRVYFWRSPLGKPALGALADADEEEHEWHLDEHTDDGSECGSGGQAEEHDCGGDGDLEVV